MVKCLTCGADFELGPDAETGQIISCFDCGAELEVTGNNSVQPAPEVEEDWGE